ncbi:MAG: serine protease [Candidatus Falkowbacteria bacterium]
MRNIGYFQKSTAEFSENYIANAVIEILYPDGSHLGNGLLLTQDGYFLTCDHCLIYPPGIMKLRMSDGRTSSRARICVRDPDHDLALCKIPLSGDECNCFKFYVPPEKKLSQPIIYLGRRGERLVRKEGNFTGSIFNTVCHTVVNEYSVKGESIIRCQKYTSTQYYGHFNMNIDAAVGDSGGVVITPDGSLVGLLSAVCLFKDKNFSAAARLGDALPIIWEYVSACI